jgi:hypothetical protein
MDVYLCQSLLSHQPAGMRQCIATQYSGQCFVGQQHVWRWLISI